MFIEAKQLIEETALERISTSGQLSILRAQMVKIASELIFEMENDAVMAATDEPVNQKI